MSYKKQYEDAAVLAYAANTLLDKATPVPADDDAWEKWEDAKAAVIRYASHVSSHPFNPVIAEAKIRGDFSYFADRLETSPTLRTSHGWSKKQVREAIPIIRKLAEEADAPRGE